MYLNFFLTFLDVFYTKNAANTKPYDGMSWAWSQNDPLSSRYQWLEEIFDSISGNPYLSAMITRAPSRTNKSPVRLCQGGGIGGGVVKGCGTRGKCGRAMMDRNNGQGTKFQL